MNIKGDNMKFIDNLNIDEYNSFINKHQVHFMQEPVSLLIILKF